MGFPVIREVKFSPVNFGQATHILSYPEDIIESDILLGVISSWEASTTLFNHTWDIADGWIKIIDQEKVGDRVGLSIAYKPAVGDESGGSTAVLTDVSCSSDALVMSIRGGDTSTIEALAANLTDTTAPNPPAITPTGGTQDYLFLTLVAFGHEFGVNGISGYPANYSLENLQDTTYTNEWNAAIGMAARELNTGVEEDPSAYTLSVQSDAVAATTVIYPVAADLVTKSYSVGFSSEVVSNEFAAGFVFVKNGSESASSIIAVTSTISVTIGTETNAILFDVIFDSGPVVDGADTVTYTYDADVAIAGGGLITDSASSIPLADIALTAVDAICT